MILHCLQQLAPATCLHRSSENGESNAPSSHNIATDSNIYSKVTGTGRPDVMLHVNKKTKHKNYQGISRHLSRIDMTTRHLVMSTEDFEALGALIEGSVVLVVHRSNGHGAVATHREVVGVPRWSNGSRLHMSRCSTPFSKYFQGAEPPQWPGRRSWTRDESDGKVPTSAISTRRDPVCPLHASEVTITAGTSRFCAS